MNKFLLGIVLGGLGLYAYQRARPPEQVQVDRGSDLQAERTQVERDDSRNAARDSSRFRCDERKHCSQMSSCEEAEFFLENCPGTKMDGDRDGIPCEDQHCGH